MAHRTRIDGTTYTITGCKSMVNGTSYSVSLGKTKIDGSTYDVIFRSTPQVYAMLYNDGSMKFQLYYQFEISYYHHYIT